MRSCNNMNFKKILLAVVLIFLMVFAGNIFFQNTKNEIPQVNMPTSNAPLSKPRPEAIPEMSKKEFKGSDLRLERVLERNAFYTRYYITYLSEGLKISGIMNVPTAAGPFPILILNHGYVDPKIYKNGTGGLQREQHYFAKNGYVVFQSDYRNYAQSDLDPDNDVRPRTGYVEDVLNGINALKISGLPFLNIDEIGMLGHSMGGGVTINIMVTKPDAANAYILLAPINADYKINFDKWVKNDFPETAKIFYERYGTYEENPQFWEEISAKNYLDKVSKPVMINQGTKDPDVPTEWSKELSESLKQKNKNVSYYEYENEGHLFYKSEDLFLQRSLEFLNQNLKK